jgi:hypothetical protein
MHDVNVNASIPSFVYMQPFRSCIFTFSSSWVSSAMRPLLGSPSRMDVRCCSRCDSSSAAARQNTVLQGQCSVLSGLRHIVSGLSLVSDMLGCML